MGSHFLHRRLCHRGYNFKLERSQPVTVQGLLGIRLKPHSGPRQFFKKFFWRHKSFSCGHWYPCFRPLVMSALGFKARVDPFLCAFSLIWSSNSPLVWHLLTVQRSAWQLSLFDPHTYRHEHKFWWRFGPGLKPTTICAVSTALCTTRPLCGAYYCSLISDILLNLIASCN